MRKFSGFYATFFILMATYTKTTRAKCPMFTDNLRAMK